MADIKYDPFFTASLKNGNKNYTSLITDMKIIQNERCPLGLEILTGQSSLGR